MRVREEKGAVELEQGQAGILLRDAEARVRDKYNDPDPSPLDFDDHDDFDNDHGEVPQGI